MKFSKVIGKIEPETLELSELILNQVILELGTTYDNKYLTSGIGGDPFVFSLLQPIEHVATANIPTAATDGRRYYWNPSFIISLFKKETNTNSKDNRVGVRFVATHEAFHTSFDHVDRRGSRNPKLWNICVDYIVHHFIMDDLRHRNEDPVLRFTNHLGKFITVDQYVSLLKDPFNPPAGLEDMKPQAKKKSSKKEVVLPAPDEERDLTEEEKAEIEKRMWDEFRFYADPNIPEDLRTPEALYDLFYQSLPKCPACGKVGIYKNPNKDKSKGKSDKKGEDQNQSPNKDKLDPSNQQQNSCCGEDHDHSEGCGKNPGNGECSECGDGIDVFDLGKTLDEHIDVTEDADKIAKRLYDAMESAKRMAGYVPAAVEEELGELMKPKITWKNSIRSRIVRARQGNTRNDWTKFKTRPMFAGIMTPKRKGNVCSFGCLLDTSGSMSKEDDIVFGISQLASLDERSEGTIVPADAQVYWDKATKLKSVRPDDLKKIKIVGRGGTVWGSFFKEYEKNIGKCDFLVVITDGYLSDVDIADMQNPGIDVYWLITSTSGFKPPFGKAYYLRDI